MWIKIRLGITLVKCPKCSSDAKVTSKEWEYSSFHVKQYKCIDCEKLFNAYYIEGKLSHVIPTPTIGLKIMDYLTKRESCTEEEIANALNLPVQDVFNTLFELKRKGKVRLASGD